MRDPQDLRVAIFSDSMPERNGAGAYYHDLVAQLEPRLAAIKVFQPARKIRLTSLALPLPGDSTQKVITPNIFRLRREFHQLDPHVVIAVTPGPFGMVGLWLARRHQRGFLTAFHTHFEELVKLYGDTLFFKLSLRYLVFINKILCKRSAAVMVNNGDLVQTVKDLGAPKVEIMGTPLADSFLNTPLQPPPPTFRQLLFAGRLAPEKNLPAVIQAARDLPEINFVLVGDGPLRKELQKQTAAMPNVRMTGWLDRPQLRDEMDACNALLLPSFHETFGTVALEAMARGRPAMVAARAGIHHWPSLNQALFSLPADQPISDTLRPLLTKPPEFWQSMARQARAAAEDLNTKTCSQWLEFLQRYAV